MGNLRRVIVSFYITYTFYIKISYKISNYQWTDALFLFWFSTLFYASWWIWRPEWTNRVSRLAASRLSVVVNDTLRLTEEEAIAAVSEPSLPPQPPASMASSAPTTSPRSSRRASRMPGVPTSKLLVISEALNRDLSHLLVRHRLEFVQSVVGLLPKKLQNSQQCKWRHLSFSSIIEALGFSERSVYIYFSLSLHTEFDFNIEHAYESPNHFKSTIFL